MAHAVLELLLADGARDDSGGINSDQMTYATRLITKDRQRIAKKVPQTEKEKEFEKTFLSKIPAYNTYREFWDHGPGFGVLNLYSVYVYETTGMESQ